MRLIRNRLCFRSSTKAIHDDTAPAMTRFFIFMAAFFSNIRYRFLVSTTSIQMSIVWTSAFWVHRAMALRTISPRRASSAASLSAKRMTSRHVLNPPAICAFASRASTLKISTRAFLRQSTNSVQPDMAPEVTRFRIFMAALFSRKRYR